MNMSDLPKNPSGSTSSSNLNSSLRIIGEGGTPTDAPKIEFPCPNYPIKVMGDACDEMHALVITVIERHAPGFDQTAISVRASSKGRFQSLTVSITATGVDQLKAIHQDLVASELIKIVL